MHARRLRVRSTSPPARWLRARLIAISAEEHLLAVTFHHTVADGWSLNLMADELGALYQRAISLAPPELQYPDYALRQRAWLEDGSPQAAEIDWWRSQLDGAPPALELPSDHPRPARPTGHGAHHEDAVGEDVTDGVEQLAADNSATPFMVLLAAFGVLLARGSGQEDIVDRRAGLGPDAP